MSGHCHDEHDHSHGHEGHDHSDDITPALQYSLYQHINFDEITTLNESEAHSGKAIVKKTWAERLEEQPELESDADEQLLIHIPYVTLPLQAHIPTNILHASQFLTQYLHVLQLHRPSEITRDPHTQFSFLIRSTDSQGLHQSILSRF